MTPGGVVGTATSASPGFQTLKKYLAKQDPPATIGQLQVQLDCFVAYDNEVRPHRALKRRTPREAFEAHQGVTTLGRHRGRGLPGPSRQGGQGREGDAAFREPIASHRPGLSPVRTTDNPLDRRPRRQGPPWGWPPDPTTDP